MRDNISDYQALFGRTGWSSIQERRDRIQPLLENVLEHLDLKPLTAPKKKLCPLNRFARRVLRKTTIRDDGLSQNSSRLSTTSIASTISLAEPTALEPISASSIEAWQVYVREENQGKNLDAYLPALPEKPNVTVIKSIIGILYANRQLDREIDELQKAIDRLHVFNRSCFYDTGHGKLNQDPERDEIDESLQLHRLQRITGELYKSYLNHNEQYQWTLELRFRQEVEGGNSLVTEIAKKGAIYFTVKHRPAPNGLISAQALTVRHIEGALTSDILADSPNLAMIRILSESSRTAEIEGLASLEFSQAGTPIFWTKSLRFLLIKSRESQEIQKIFSLERTRVAYGCVLWMILLWKTDWFANLCSCGFRSAVEDNQTRLSMLSIVDEEMK